MQNQDFNDPKLKDKLQDLADNAWAFIVKEAQALGMEATVPGFHPPFDTMDGGNEFKQAMINMLIPILK